MAFLDELGKKLTQTGQDTVKKAKDLADVTKLNSQLSDAGRQLQDCYRSVGEKYFELHRENPQAELEPLCAEVSAALELISTTRGEIQKLKNIKVCPSCGCENPFSACFCSSCSTKLPDLPGVAGTKRHCPICGGEVPEGAAFCTKCGNKIEN